MLLVCLALCFCLVGVVTQPSLLSPSSVIVGCETTVTVTVTVTVVSHPTITIFVYNHVNDRCDAYLLPRGVLASVPVFFA